MSENKLKRSITWKQGTAMSISAVIGCGILILPALTAREGGPVSLLVWTLVSILIFPIVYVLAKLAQLHPKAGGIASYASLAFGKRFGVITSWVYLGSIPIGLPTIALSGAYYLKYFLPLSYGQVVLVAAAILFLALYLNIKGIDISSKVSTIIVIVIIALLLLTIIFSIPHVEMSAFHPFMPKGIKAAFSLLPSIFFAFAGWEMIAPLAEEFKNPEKDIKKSLFLSALFVTVLYVVISFVTVGTSVYKAEDSNALLSALISLSFGKIAGFIVSTLTLLITFCTIHANIAGFSRIIYNGAREGGFPKLFSKIHPKFRTPINALLAIGVDFILMLLFFLIVNPNLNEVTKFPGSVFLASYIIALISAVKILKVKTLAWWGALFTLIICLGIYFIGGLTCLFPIMLAIVGYIFTRKKY